MRSLTDIYYDHGLHEQAYEERRQSVSFVLRCLTAPMAVAKAVRLAIRELEPDLALYWVSTMEEVIAQSTAGTRFLAVLLAAFGILAVVLAIVGVYGVMSSWLVSATVRLGCAWRWAPPVLTSWDSCWLMLRGAR